MEHKIIVIHFCSPCHIIFEPRQTLTNLPFIRLPMHPDPVPAPEELVKAIEARGEKVFSEYSPGRQMCWHRFGNGANVVLLHGDHGSWLHWIRNVEALSKTFTLWVPDLAGFGDSDTPPDGFGTREMADAANSSLSLIIGADTAVGVCGFSFGGMIATQLAALRPSVTRLATIGVAGHGGAHRLLQPMVQWRGLTPEAEIVALRQNLVSLMLTPRSADDDLALQVHRTSCHGTRYRSRDLSRQGALQDLLRHLSLPIKFIWGSEDVTAIPHTIGANLIHDHRERTLTIVPGAGHWAQFEASRQINELLTRWFS
jgi:2-hydroxy-6-oxonona-2,4-dienedioate hydrolase